MQKLFFGKLFLVAMLFIVGVSISTFAYASSDDETDVTTIIEASIARMSSDLQKNQEESAMNSLSESANVIANILERVEKKEAYETVPEKDIEEIKSLVSSIRKIQERIDRDTSVTTASKFSDFQDLGNIVHNLTVCKTAIESISSFHKIVLHYEGWDDEVAEKITATLSQYVDAM